MVLMLKRIVDDAELLQELVMGTYLCHVEKLWRIGPAALSEFPIVLPTWYSVDL
jgi:hypothetical protein